MLIWRGWGILPVLIAGLAVVAMIGLHDGLKLRYDWLMSATIVAAAVANWFVGRWFNRPLEQAGIGYWKRHWLLFIQMEWWSLFFLILALNVAIKGTLF